MIYEEYIVFLHMQYIQGNHRNQAVLFPKCLDELVDQDNEVRIIDLFVESINLEDFKYIVKTIKRTSADEA